MEQIDPKVREYIKELLSEPGLTRETLLEGEEHYTPPTKRALRRAGRKVEEESLSDEDAQIVKESVRIGQGIVEDNKGFYQGPPGLRAIICKSLQRMGDDMSDALTVVSALMAVGTASTAATGQLAYAVIAFTVVRLGVRHVCHNAQ